MLRAPLLAATLLATAGPVFGLGPGDPIVAELGDLVPAHHPLHGFTGDVAWYEYRPPPPVRYEQPDFEAWAATLDPAEPDSTADRFVAVWRDAASSIRYVLTRGDLVRVFTIEADRIEFEDPGFQTQVGVARWGWIYRDGLLRTHRTWRLALGPPDETGRLTAPPAPTALFAVIDYEYGRSRTVPTRSRTYWSEEDRQAGRWGQKSWYDADGRLEKVRHNPERPYPY